MRSLLALVALATTIAGCGAGKNAGGGGTGGAGAAGLAGAGAGEGGGGQGEAGEGGAGGAGEGTAGGGAGGAGMGGAGAGGAGAGGAGGATGMVSVRVVAFNDFHGALAASGTSVPGAAALAGTIAAHRTPATLVVSAGDLLGGSPLISGLFHDEPTIEVMNTIGLDFNGVGNHEFDEGTAELLRMRNGGCHPVDGCKLGSTFMGSQFEFLAANVTVAVTGQPILPAFEVRDVGGAKIAIVGLTLRDTPGTTVASLIPELAFADEVASVRALEPAVQAAGAKSIVVLAHVSGGIAALPPTCGSLTGPIVDLADRLPDSVVMVQGAHSHAVYNCKRGTKLVTSAGSAGALVTVADFQIDLATQTVVSSSAENVTVGADPPDPAVQALLDRYDRLVAPLRDRVIGTITTDIVAAAAPPTGEQPMGDVIADAMLAGSRSAGAMAALMNPGGIRASLSFARSGAETADGQVTYGEAFAVQPFSNTVTTLTATGTEVAAALSAGVARSKPFQVSGLTYTWQLTTPPRVDVADVTIAGSPIVATATYRITVNSIGEADFPAATDRIGLGVDLDLLIPYLTANSPLSPPPGGRISTR